MKIIPGRSLPRRRQTVKRIETEQVSLGKKNGPEFMQHDPVVANHLASLYSEFLPFQFAIYSENVIAGTGNAVPIHFEDAFINLPFTGLYTIDNALCPITIDFEKNIGEYIEPDTWIIHLVK